MSTEACPKKVFEPDPNTKIFPKGPKSEREARMLPNQKQKDRAVLPKSKLIVYIVPKKFLNLTPTPEIELKGGKKVQKRPQLWQN